jgi:superfamily II DNA or RNA helicase
MITLKQIIKKILLFFNFKIISINYKELNEDDKTQVDELIDILIRNKYKFINYNGITKQRWDVYTQKNAINPFDNSVIVIDEVHNFVSRIINKIRTKKKSISTFIYEAILDAENCKIVALSGTPYINYPDELGILFNIILIKSFVTNIFTMNNNFKAI